jgi:rfaE bifunctional protein nucleotidyltransferase chain/domain
MVVERFPIPSKRRSSSPSSLDSRSKIKSLEELGRVAEACRTAGHKVVLAHGVFDLLHLGHLRHLEEARSHGDILIVTLTADAFVNKGPGKPVFSEQQRAEMLSGLGIVDWVGVNNAPDANSVLRAIKPDVYAKGADYRNLTTMLPGKSCTNAAPSRHLAANSSLPTM